MRQLTLPLASERPILILRAHAATVPVRRGLCSAKAGECRCAGIITFDKLSAHHFGSRGNKEDRLAKRPTPPRNPDRRLLH